MTEPHRIRLRSPWTVSADTPEIFVHARPFGQPRLSQGGERVWLVIDTVLGRGEVRLNGCDLGRVEAGIPFAVDATEQLTPRNLLEVILTDSNDLGGATAGVRLEIRPGPATSC